MSDIGFYGIVAGLAGAAMVALACAGLVLEAILWGRRRARRPRGSREDSVATDRGPRGRRPPGKGAFLAPAGYATTGVAVLVVADLGSLEVREAMDRIAPVVAVLGLVLWLGYRLRLARAAVAER